MMIYKTADAKLKPKVQPLGWFWLMLSILFTVTDAFPQSSNRDAVKWFNIGLKERNDYKAIEAYKRAIALDPEFIEAIINAGMRYKRVGDLEQAEQFLKIALSAMTGNIATDMKSKILYEVAKIYLRKGDHKAYEKKMEAARAATQNRTLLAALSFEHGRFLYQQKRYREAVIELQKGLLTNPLNREYFENLISLADNAQQLKNIYTKATAEEVSGRFETALALFEQIQRLDSDFVDVEQKISRLRAQIDAENEKKSLSTLYTQAANDEKRGKLETAIEIYEDILRKSPNYRDTRQKHERARKNLRRKTRFSILNNKYAVGLKALQEDDLIRAMIVFEEVLAVDSNFKDARQRLEAARKRIESKTTESVVSRYYRDGIEAMLQGSYEQALRIFIKIYAIDSDYKNIEAKIAEAEDMLRETRKFDPPNILSLESQAKKDSLFQVAETFMEKQDWQAALSALEQIHTFSPGDARAIEYIAAIRAKLTIAATAPAYSGRSSFGKIVLFAGGAVTLLIVLPLAGAFVFVPTVRMRYFLMVGNLVRAACIIEKLLEQNPGRLKLYPVLANIYLLNRRNDARAIKIYRTVVQLNLAKQNKQAIDAMLAQYYMVESSETDQEVLRILEEKLQDEMQKKRNS